jgi:predicted RNA binding protein YcfA (HicA-like mRNA interferase family)
MVEKLTYGDLHQVLIDLGFVANRVPDSHVSFRHEPSDTVILMALHASTEATKPIDVKYVRRVLDERGLLAGAEFDRQIGEIYAPHSA